MKAPTNITGPDGTLCAKGSEIPEDWFEQLPDLRDHLAAIRDDGDGDPPTAKSKVKASAVIDRRRTSS